MSKIHKHLVWVIKDTSKMTKKDTKNTHGLGRCTTRFTKVLSAPCGGIEREADGPPGFRSNGEVTNLVQMAEEMKQRLP